MAGWNRYAVRKRLPSPEWRHCCQKIVACPNSKMFVKALRMVSVNLTEFYPDCNRMSAAMTSKHFVQLVLGFSFKSTRTCPATSGAQSRGRTERRRRVSKARWHPEREIRKLKVLVTRWFSYCIATHTKLHGWSGNLKTFYELGNHGCNANPNLITFSWDMWHPLFQTIFDFPTRAGLRGRAKGAIAPGPPLQGRPPRWNLFVSNKILVWKIS